MIHSYSLSTFLSLYLRTSHSVFVKLSRRSGAKLLGLRLGAIHKSATAEGGLLTFHDFKLHKVLCFSSG